jgi:hypothetical protein
MRPTSKRFRTSLDGQLTAAPPLGPSGLVVLDGRKLHRVTVSGTLKPSDRGLRLTVPVVLSFNFGVGGARGTVTRPGTLAAEM